MLTPLDAAVFLIVPTPTARRPEMMAITTMSSTSVKPLLLLRGLEQRFGDDLYCVILSESG